MWAQGWGPPAGNRGPQGAAFPSRLPRFGRFRYRGAAAASLELVGMGTGSGELHPPPQPRSSGPPSLPAASGRRLGPGSRSPNARPQARMNKGAQGGNVPFSPPHSGAAGSPAPRRIGRPQLPDAWLRALRTRAASRRRAWGQLQPRLPGLRDHSNLKSWSRPASDSPPLSALATSPGPEEAEQTSFPQPESRSGWEARRGGPAGQGRGGAEARPARSLRCGPREPVFPHKEQTRWGAAIYPRRAGWNFPHLVIRKRRLHFHLQGARAPVRMRWDTEHFKEYDRSHILILYETTGIVVYMLSIWSPYTVH